MAVKWITNDATGYLTPITVSYTIAVVDAWTICAEVYRPASGWCRIGGAYVAGGAGKRAMLDMDTGYVRCTLKDDSGVVQAALFTPTGLPASTATRVVGRYSGGANGTVYVGYYNGGIVSDTEVQSGINWPGTTTMDRLAVGYNGADSELSANGFKVAHFCFIAGDIGSTASNDFLTNGTNPLSLGGTALHYFYDSLTAHTGSGTFSEGAATITLADTPTSTIADPGGGGATRGAWGSLYGQRNLIIS